MSSQVEMRDKIHDLINEVAPPPLCVSGTAIRQLWPLLEELVRRRGEPQGSAPELPARPPMVGEYIHVDDFDIWANAANEKLARAERGPCCREPWCEGVCTCEICAPDLTIGDLRAELESMAEAQLAASLPPIAELLKTKFDYDHNRVDAMAMEVTRDHPAAEMADAYRAIAMSLCREVQSGNQDTVLAGVGRLEGGRHG